MGWIARPAGGAVLLSLHVQPGARSTEFCGLHGEAMKLRLAAPPVDGKANAALIAYLADFLEVPRSAVTLLSGHSSRAKRLRVDGVPEAALARLLGLAGEAPPD